jgi:hypothetical protein
MITIDFNNSKEVSPYIGSKIRKDGNSRHKKRPSENDLLKMK